MLCRMCKSDNHRVIDSRPLDRERIRRRRKCRNCGARWSTVEGEVVLSPEVMKNTGGLNTLTESYSRLALFDRQLMLRLIDALAARPKRKREHAA